MMHAADFTFFCSGHLSLCGFQAAHLDERRGKALKAQTNTRNSSVFDGLEKFLQHSIHEAIDSDTEVIP